MQEKSSYSRNGNETRESHAGGGPVWNMAVSPDGQSVVTTTNTGSVEPGDIPIEPVHVVRLSDGATVGEPLDHSIPFGGADGLVYTPDGSYIVAGHGQMDGAVHVIDAHSFDILDLVHAGSPIYDVAVNHVDQEFALATGNRVEIWSLPSR